MEDNWTPPSQTMLATSGRQMRYFILNDIPSGDDRPGLVPRASLEVFLPTSRFPMEIPVNRGIDLNDEEIGKLKEIVESVTRRVIEREPALEAERQEHRVKWRASQGLE